MWAIALVFVAMIGCLTLASGISRSRGNLKRLQRRDPEAAARLAQQLVEEQRYGRSAGQRPDATRGFTRRRF
jgi:hypothetical protein